MASLYNKKYYDADVALLHRNRMILEEAANPQNALYKRIEYLATFSSNLDAFIKIQLSAIRHLKKIKKPFRSRFIKNPKKILKQFLLEIDEQQKECYYIFKEEIVPALKNKDIYIIHNHQFSTTQKLVAATYFKDTIHSQLNYQKYNSNENKKIPFSHQEDDLYLTALKDKVIHLVEIPPCIPRFFVFPKINGKYYVTFLDDILKYNLRQTPSEEIDLNFYSFKISKDAPIYLEDELYNTCSDYVIPTRITIDGKAPFELQKAIYDCTDVVKIKITKGTTYQNLKDFKYFPDFTNGLALKNIA